MIQVLEIINCEPGLKFNGAIYKNDKDPYVIHEVKLTEDMLNTLKRCGCKYLYCNASQQTELDAKHKMLQLIESCIQSCIQKIQINLAPKEEFNEIIGHLLFRRILSDQEAINLLMDMYANDRYLFTHSINVALYSLLVSLELELSRNEIIDIGTGALFHDVGKMLLPKSLINKEDRLTDKEFNIIRCHSLLGYEMLRTTSILSKDAEQILYQHHERLDGSGYPSGCKEDGMHLFAKIVAVTDVYDALTSNRPYKDAYSRDVALNLLIKDTPLKFDSAVVNKLIAVVDSENIDYEKTLVW